MKPPKPDCSLLGSLRRIRPWYGLGWFLFRMLFATYFRWRIFNPERVPLTGPVLLASNHASFLDPPIVGGAAPREVYYLARETLFRFPPMGALLRSWNSIPIDREGNSSSAIKTVLEALQSGKALVMFPEGTRSKNGELQPARSGVGMIVIKTDAAVVPARVFGTYKAFGRHMKIPLPRRVMVKYGHPMYFRELRQEAKTCTKARLKQIYQEISDEIMREISRLEPSEEVDQFPAR